MDNLTVIEKYDFTEMLKSTEPKAFTERPMRICFVCTGNTCRSPMAAAVLNHLGVDRFSASSAGLSAFNGDSISEEAIKALEKSGVSCTEKNNYKNHSSRRVTEDILKDADTVVAISGRHMMALLYAYPSYAEKITVMKKDISDPYMLGQSEYEKCLSEITECIKEMFSL